MLMHDLKELETVDEQQLDRDIAQMERDIEAIRRTHPHCVPPPIPVRPRRPSPEHEEWKCASQHCQAANHFEMYRCIKCGLPRMAIPPEERRRCPCHKCRTDGERLSVAPAGGDDDWMLVNQ
ncbi:unnamed protein product, partial [Mesorhabditis spiculigera]